jgi:hypothetical protein
MGFSGGEKMLATQWCAAVLGLTEEHGGSR